MTAVRFAILGPVEVTAGGTRLVLGGPRTRAVLARLIVAANQVVAAEALAGELWPDLEAGRAAANLQVRMAELRRALGRAGAAERLVTRGRGYLLVAGPGEVDAAVFDQLAARGRALLAAGDPAGAAGCLEEALGLWRGPPLADAGDWDWDWARAEAARLGDARLAAVECHLQARLDCGEAGELTAELEALTGGHRLRERLWALRMLALYRSGRQAEALGAYQQLRTILVDELGIEPSAELRELHQQILAQDPALAAPPAAGRVPDAEAVAVTGGASVAVATVPVGTVTFLVTDIEGSTGLLTRLGESRYAQVLAGHHALIRAGLAAHGGREVDTQGDAFFAVFSSPRGCVAAALEMQQALAAHPWPGGEQVRVRMGITTGEASQTDTGLVGLDVHRAARVAAAGYGGQVLLSEAAAALVRDSLPPGVSLADLGVHRLKDLGRPERIFQLQAAGLQREFPPLRSLGNPALPNNLPGQLSAFVGRARELSEVRALVESSRLVTLTGAGGSGKTRLGLQAAAGLLDGSGDGVWLVELAAVTDQEAVASAICQALGIAAQLSRPSLETLTDALAPQNVLVVLDNCEHLIGGCAKTAEAIVTRCPRVHLLATSREPLGIGGETIYRVPSLSLPEPGGDAAAAKSADAVALFLERARAQGAGLVVDAATVSLLVSVCARLDGLPLAIELAAARLRSMSLGSLHDRLDQRLRLLTGGSRTALPRQQTLRATVEWSYSLLNGAEQELLGRLAVFADSFDLDAAEAVCGFGDIDRVDVAGLLGSLVDKSLVVAEPAGPSLRYRLLETIRQFAADQLTQTGEHEVAAVRAAHCAHYLSVAETAAPHLTGPDQGKWLAWLDADQANLRRAAEHAASDPDGTAQVLRLGVALKRYWRARRSLAGEPLALLLPVLDRPQAQDNLELFTEALATAARSAVWIDLTMARRLGEQAVTLARQLGTERLLIETLAALSSFYSTVGEPEQGPSPGQEAVQLARQLGDDVLLGESLLPYLAGDSTIDPADARPLFTEAIAATQRSGDHLVAYLLANLAADNALIAGDIRTARACLDHAAQAVQAIGDEDIYLLFNMGWLQRQDNDPDGARASFQQALRISRRNAHRVDIAYTILGLACLAADTGNWHRAAELHGVAQAFLDRTGIPWEPLEARYRQASLDQIHAHLGHEQSERAYATGMALSPAQALDLAAGKNRPA
jgi:predicted ATPase/DNA-binding SARP family transcriptional activator